MAPVQLHRIGCQVCIENFSSVGKLKYHTRSNEHYKRMSEVFPQGMSKHSDAFCNIHVMEYLATRKPERPILGLSMMTACHSSDLRRLFYLCHLCEETCTQGQIMGHLFSPEHMTKYYTDRDPDVLSFAWFPYINMLKDLTPIAKEDVKKNGNGVLQVLDLPQQLFSAIKILSYASAISTLKENDKLAVRLKESTAKRLSVQNYMAEPSRKHALLGLQHLVECLCEGESVKKFHLCTLCQITLRENAIISHVISFDHIYRYISAWHPGTLNSKHCYTDYSPLFKTSISHYAQQAEERSGTDNKVKRLTVKPEVFDSLDASYTKALNTLETISEEVYGSSLITSVQPGDPLEAVGNMSVQSGQGASDYPERPSRKSLKLHCQNCKVDLYLSIYAKHVHQRDHTVNLRTTFGSAVEDDERRVGIPKLELCRYIKWEEPIIGLAFIVICICTEANLPAVHICFACSKCFMHTDVVKHMKSQHHALTTVLQQRVPFGWTEEMDRTVLSQLVPKEHPAKEHHTVKVFDIPYRIFSKLHFSFSGFTKGGELRNFQHHMKNGIPWSMTQLPDEYPLLGQDFVVRYTAVNGLNSNYWTVLCLLCGRKLKKKECHAHVLSYEHAKNFLEKAHCGSLDGSDVSRETLLDLARQAAKTHPVKKIQTMVLHDPLLESFEYLKAVQILQTMKWRQSNRELIPVLSAGKRLFPTDILQEKGRGHVESEESGSSTPPRPGPSKTEPNSPIETPSGPQKAEEGANTAAPDTTSQGPGISQPEAGMDLEVHPALKIKVESEMTAGETTPSEVVQEQTGMPGNVKQEVPLPSPPPPPLLPPPLPSIKLEPNDSCRQSPASSPRAEPEDGREEAMVEVFTVSCPTQTSTIEFKKEITVRRKRTASRSSEPNDSGRQRPAASPRAEPEDGREEAMVEVFTEGSSTQTSTVAFKKEITVQRKRKASRSSDQKMRSKRLRLPEDEKEPLSRPSGHPTGTDNATEEASLKDLEPARPQIDKAGPPASSSSSLWDYIQLKDREPVIGLSTLLECHCEPHAPIYLCKCCRLKIPEEEIVVHITGFEHQKRYLKLPSNGKKTLKTPRLAALKHEQREGFGEAQVVELTPKAYRKMSKHSFDFAFKNILARQNAAQMVPTVPQVASCNPGLSPSEAQPQSTSLGLSPTSTTASLASGPGKTTHKKPCGKLIPAPSTIAPSPVAPSLSQSRVTFASPLVTSPKSIPNTSNKLTSVLKVGSALKSANLPRAVASKNTEATADKGPTNHGAQQPSSQQQPSLSVALSSTFKTASFAIDKSKTTHVDQDICTRKTGWPSKSALPKNEIPAKTPVDEFLPSPSVTSVATSLCILPTQSSVTLSKPPVISLKTTPSTTNMMTTSSKLGNPISAVHSAPTVDKVQRKNDASTVRRSTTIPQRGDNSHPQPALPPPPISGPLFPKTPGEQSSTSTGQGLGSASPTTPVYGSNTCPPNTAAADNFKAKGSSKNHPVIGKCHLVSVICEERRQLYCLLCSVRLKSSDHMISSSHRYKSLKFRFSDIKMEGNLELDEKKMLKMVVHLAEIEKEQGIVVKTVGVNSELYNWLATVSDEQAVAKAKELVEAQSHSSTIPSTAKGQKCDLEPHGASYSADAVHPSNFKQAQSNQPELRREHMLSWHQLRRIEMESKNCYTGGVDSQPHSLAGIAREAVKATPEPQQTSPCSPDLSMKSPAWPEEQSNKVRPPPPATAAGTAITRSPPSVPPALEEANTHVPQQHPARPHGQPGTKNPSVPPAVKPDHPSAANPDPTEKCASQMESKGEKILGPSALSTFLMVDSKTKPIIGLASVFECRALYEDTFYLCRSCMETFPIKLICKHIESTKHQLTYMLKVYPQFMGWWEMDLPLEGKQKLLSEIALWISARESNDKMDAQVILLRKDCYDYIRKAPFIQALDTLQNISIRETKLTLLSGYQKQLVTGIWAIIECSCEGQTPFYLCVACGHRLSRDLVLLHVQGHSHRQVYLSARYPQCFGAAFWANEDEALPAHSLQLARELEERNQDEPRTMQRITLSQEEFNRIQPMTFDQALHRLKTRHNNQGPTELLTCVTSKPPPATKRPQSPFEGDWCDSNRVKRKRLESTPECGTLTASKSPDVPRLAESFHTMPDVREASEPCLSPALAPAPQAWPNAVTTQQGAFLKSSFEPNPSHPPASASVPLVGPVETSPRTKPVKQAESFPVSCPGNGTQVNDSVDIARFLEAGVRLKDGIKCNSQPVPGVSSTKHAVSNDTESNASPVIQQLRHQETSKETICDYSAQPQVSSSVSSVNCSAGSVAGPIEHISVITGISNNSSPQAEVTADPVALPSQSNLGLQGNSRLEHLPHSSMLMKLLKQPATSTHAVGSTEPLAANPSVTLCSSTSAATQSNDHAHNSTEKGPGASVSLGFFPGQPYYLSIPASGYLDYNPSMPMVLDNRAVQYKPSLYYAHVNSGTVLAPNGGPVHQPRVFDHSVWPNQSQSEMASRLPGYSSSSWGATPPTAVAQSVPVSSYHNAGFPVGAADYSTQSTRLHTYGNNIVITNPGQPQSNPNQLNVQGVQAATSYTFPQGMDAFQFYNGAGNGTK